MKVFSYIAIYIFLSVAICAADFLVRAERDTAPTSTGNQTFTATGLGGATPKGVLFFTASDNTNSTIVPGAYVGVGATDCTNQWASGGADEDNQAAPDNHRGGSNDKVISIWGLSTPSTEVGRAAFVSCQANSITVNWTAVSGNEEQVLAVMFAGSDAAVHVDVNDASSTIGGTVNVSAGIEADFIFAMNYCVSGGTPMDFGWWMFSWGAATRTGGFHHASYSVAIDDDDDPTRVVNSSQTNRLIKSMNMTDSPGFGVCTEVSITDMSATGWTMRTDDSNIAGAGKAIFHFALQLTGGFDADVRHVTTATSTGAQSWGSLPFQPQASILIGTTLTARDVVVEDNATPHEGFAFGYAGSNLEASNSAVSSDNATTTDTSSVTNTKMLHVLTRGNTVAYSSDFTGFTSGGLTYNQDTAPGSAFDVILMSFSAGTAPSVVRRRVLPQMIKMP